MAGGFFEVRDFPAQRQVVFRRISGPRDTVYAVVWLGDAALAKLTAVSNMPFADLVSYDAAVISEVFYTQDYKPLPPPVSVKANAAPTGKKVGDKVTVASLFTFTSSTEPDYTITAAPAASADLTTTAGSVEFKAPGDVTITATNKKDPTVTASVKITTTA